MVDLGMYKKRFGFILAVVFLLLVVVVVAVPSGYLSFWKPKETVKPVEPILKTTSNYSGGRTTSAVAPPSEIKPTTKLVLIDKKTGIEKTISRQDLRTTAAGDPYRDVSYTVITSPHNPVVGQTITYTVKASALRGINALSISTYDSVKGDYVVRKECKLYYSTFGSCSYQNVYSTSGDYPYSFRIDTRYDDKSDIGWYINYQQFEVKTGSKTDSKPPSVSVEISPANPVVGQSILYSLSATDEKSLNRFDIEVDWPISGLGKTCYSYGVKTDACSYTIPSSLTTGAEYIANVGKVNDFVNVVRIYSRIGVRSSGSGGGSGGGGGGGCLKPPCQPLIQ